MTTVEASRSTQAGAPTFLGYRSLMWNFAQRDLKSRFKGTAVGWGWSLLLPLASLGIYYLVSRVILKGYAPPLGNGHPEIFVIYLFAGLTIWSYFSNGINTAIGSLLGTGGLLKKIYFPSYAPVLGAIIAVSIQSAVEFGLILVVLLALANLSWSWLLIVPWAFLLVCFVSGCALMLAIANIYLRDLGHIVSVFLQLMFYATPIIYPPTVIPVSTHGVPLRQIIMLSPVSRFIEVFRELAYGLTYGSITSWVYLLVWTAVALGGGALVFLRFGRDLGEEL